jgi:hypothetical protein
LFNRNAKSVTNSTNITPMTRARMTFTMHWPEGPMIVSWLPSVMKNLTIARNMQSRLANLLWPRAS